METFNNIASTIKKGVLNNSQYKLKTINCQIKLNQNESPYDFPYNLKNSIIKKLARKNWNIYPEFIPESTIQKIADSFKLLPDNILLGNGSNEMIFTILAATIETGKKIIIPQPTFTVYKLIASNLNADIKEIMLNDDFTFNINKIIEEVKTPGSVAVICSPNNPTGTYIKYQNLLQIIKSSKGIVIVDEAYIHFGGESVIGLINEYSNLIVLRTFSKAFGLAGLRIGMMLASSALIVEIAKMKLPYNLNVLSLLILDEVFNNLDYVEKNVKRIISDKIYLEKALSEFKELTIIPSATNFFLLKVNDSKIIFNKLLEYSILVRDVSSYPMLENCLRISVGSKNENKALINALQKIYKKD